VDQQTNPVRRETSPPHSDPHRSDHHREAVSFNAYFGWEDARNDDARGLAERFVARFPLTVAAGAGRDGAYAGRLAELFGFLAAGDGLPFVRAEDSKPDPLMLRALPIREFGAAGVILDFPLPPPVPPAEDRAAAFEEPPPR
jgi:hypothetical protein